MLNCDRETAVCHLPDSLAKHQPAPMAKSSTATVHYVGDPMCSWCWGLSPELQAIARQCQSQGLGFSLQVGGLRAGGGDVWNSAFKTFLRNEWQHIQQVTAQPFGYSLLDLAEFNYDTEPACRAVVAFKQLQADSLAQLAFFAAVQHHFYVTGADPKQAEFYRSPCEMAGINYAQFLEVFLAPQTAHATAEEFKRCRNWGVRGFPSLLLEQHGKIQHLASGYVTSAALFEKITALLKVAQSA